MPIYNFVQRNPKSGNPQVVAQAEVIDGTNVKWSGRRWKKIRKWLINEVFLKLPENEFSETSTELPQNKFDETLLRHWKKLPELVSGSYLWVAKE